MTNAFSVMIGIRKCVIQWDCLISRCWIYEQSYPQTPLASHHTPLVGLHAQTADGRMDRQMMEGCMESLPILQDFIPCLATL